jgi:DNA-binding XRE family transcriptional regulator/mannose-6-phosphate isomerase-like protein (cupin superfamily)
MAQDLNIGARLKARRQELSLSLRELARRTDLSASFLSQIELNKTSLSIDSMRRIAEALDAPLLSFLSDQAATPEEEGSISEPVSPCVEPDDPYGYSPVVRAGCRPKLTLPPSGVTYELLTREMGRKMEALCGRMAPGTANIARRLREPTEELIYVLSGSLSVGLNDKEYTLNRGDSIYFTGDQLQKLACASTAEDVIWISVITPSVF